ncbi:alkaline phosphatase family protein [Simiduia litorea]|uniref:alkaline phosphatase family protein n=1 Tax=Simiduia litorea TaxID=1435348 RepID=UPI0036F1FAA0
MTKPKPPHPEETRILPNIDHIVYLMFENRSLDNLLGWLYDKPPKNMIPPIPHGPQYDGLREKTYKLPLKPHYWSPVTYYPIKKGVGKNGFTVPNLDPNEAYPNVMNQLFGDAEHTVKVPPQEAKPALMQGFLQDFDADDDTWNETLQITDTYTPSELPVLNGLAKQYAVSDRWYSSMPTQTNPNRAFALCGTSLGRLKNKNIMALEQFKTPTIWNALAAKKTEMGIYFHETWHDNQCFTQYTFPNMNTVDKSLLDIRKIDAPDMGFYARAQAGNLPAFSYIEPKWGYGAGPHTMRQGNDYHPPTDVRYGEKLLHNVYTALKSNPKAWERTLLIVTFDEHGGTYDHHAPAWGAVNPGDEKSRNSAFKFNLYGVRVPTLLVSPQVPEGTVFREPLDSKYPFDHTSILATLLKWRGIDPAKANLFDRVASAPTFEAVVNTRVINKGANIPNPGDNFDIDACEDLFEGIPSSIVRYISSIAKTRQRVIQLIEDYKAHQT